MTATERTLTLPAADPSVRPLASAPAREVSGWASAGSLGWAVAIYCAVMGALMLVLPHQFQTPAYLALVPHLHWWGSLFLLAGSALLVVTILDVPPALAAAVHLLAGAGLLRLAWGFAATGATSGVVIYAILGIGSAVAPFVARRTSTHRYRGTLREHTDLLMLVLGCSAAGIGAIEILLPQQYVAAMYDPIRPWLARWGAVFLCGGLALITAQVLPGMRRSIRVTAHLMAAGVFLSYMIAVALPARGLTGLVYYGGFGAAILLLPWLVPRLRAVDRRSLRTRLALAMTGVTVVPLVVAVALVANQVDERVAEQAARTQRVLAAVIARHVANDSGNRVGLVSGGVQTARLLREVDGASVDGREVYLVDGTGHVIVSPDASSLNLGADLSARPPVAALLRALAGGSAGEGALRFLAPDGERLAGYAAVPELGWGVVVERPATVALAGVRAARDVAAVVLVVAVGLATTLGLVTAGYLAAPLSTLTRAVEALAAANPAGQLPNRGPTEVRRLARRFGEMRARLVAGAAERERLLECERAARAAAEQAMSQRDRVLQDVRCKLWRATVTERDGDLHWDAEYINEAAVRKYFPVAGAEHAPFQEYIRGWLHQRVPEDLARNSDYVLQKVLAGEDYTVDFRWRRADGEIRWLRERVEVTPLAPAPAGRDGEEPGPRRWEVVGVTVDVTDEHLLAEERLRRAIEAAEAEHAVRVHAETERLRDQFFANVSHDLRTPLMAIKASLGVVLANEPPDFPASLHRLLANAGEAGDRMERLIADLLELTRLRAGRVPFDPRRHDLRDVAQAAARSIEALAQARGQRLEVDLPDGPVWAAVDPGRIEQALLNVIGNAQKYGRAGGTIHLVLERRQTEAVISVSDDGPGIPAADRERVFERFYRSSEVSGGSVSGSGLGLAITRALVELQNGRSWVESPPDGGATFRIAIPVDAALPVVR